MSTVKYSEYFSSLSLDNFKSGAGYQDMFTKDLFIKMTAQAVAKPRHVNCDDATLPEERVKISPGLV